MAEENDGADDDAVALDDDLDPVTDDQVEHEVDEPIDVEAAMIAAARRRHGSFGAVVAAGMLGFEKVLGRKPREEAPIVVDAPTEPIDIDSDGITVPVDELTSVVAPPLPRVAPRPTLTRRRRR